MSKKTKKAVFLLIAFLFCPSLYGLPPDSESSFTLNHEPTRKRQFLLPPLGSFLLPSFDQWLEDQRPAGFAYGGAALFGYALSESVLLSHSFGASDNSLTTQDDYRRLYMLGAQIYMAAGSFSVYHSFRSAVRSRPNDFSFLSEEESPSDLLKAPVNFSFLARPTTLFPLAAISALLVIETRSETAYHWVFPRAQDLGFAGAFSYLAGTNEEALFRGWIMPVGMYYVNNAFVSNLFTSALFSAAHISKENPIPWPQFVLGFYLGWVSQYRDWTLAEGIFIHTWWDVIAFVASYSFQKAAEVPHVLHLPPLLIRF